LQQWHCLLGPILRKQYPRQHEIPKLARVIRLVAVQ
jgi:hypothetical protein